MTKNQIIDLTIMRNPITVVAQAIAGDIESSMAEAGERLTNAIMIESCIDAGRMTSFARGEAGKADATSAEAELARAIKAHGYPKVINALSRAIRIV